MRVTIEIEPEEAARFLKSVGVPLTASEVVQYATESTPINPFNWWNKAATDWLDAIRSTHASADDKNS